MILNLCSGPFPSRGHLNADIRKYPGTNVVCDARALPFRDGSFEYLFFSHAIEHFTYDEAMDILKNLKRILKRGGTVHIEGPDIVKAVFSYFGSDKIAQFLFGGLDDVRRDPLYAHKWGYTGGLVGRELEKIGMKVLEIGDGKTHGWPKRDYCVKGVKQ